MTAPYPVSKTASLPDFQNGNDNGPPLFWDVRFFSPRIVSDGARHFGTKESALAFHAEVVERIISGEFEA